MKLLSGPNGGDNTINGLKPADFWDHQEWLEQRMNDPLMISSTPPTLNPKFAPLPGGFGLPIGATGAGSSAAETLVNDVISCAIDKDVNLLYSGKSYDTSSAYANPDRVLQTASGWKSASLVMRSDERLDLYTCIATRLNPMGVAVPIWLGGYNKVTNVTGTASDPYVLKEAYWAAKYNGAHLEIFVWPASTWIDDMCPAKFVSALKTRDCGKAGGAIGCQLFPETTALMRGPLCKQDAAIDNYWKCQDPEEPSGTTYMPVIETRLNCESWCSLYPGCKVPGDIDATHNCRTILGKATCDPLN